MAPDLWAKGIINPISKDTSKDRREPLNYRGITLSSCVYKLYCSIFNCHMGIWAEENDLIEDEQNGFRKGQSCHDHLSSITSIIDTRRQANKLTYVDFVDFSEAYDRINRLFMWASLEELDSKVFKSPTVLYQHVEYCIKINGVYTDC